MAYVLHVMTSRAERLAEFISRLAAAEACDSADAALTQLSDILKAVEDEFSGVEFDPDFPRDDGRMYPPREDSRRRVDGRPDLRRYRSVAHNTFVSEDGALPIEGVRDKLCLIDKPARNGRRIEL